MAAVANSNKIGRFVSKCTNAAAIERFGSADADGTASILDICQISAEPDYGCAAPFSASELKQYFGTERPTRKEVGQAEDFWDELERGQARYAVVYANYQPSEIYFAGYSFD